MFDYEWQNLLTFPEIQCALPYRLLVSGYEVTQLIIACVRLIGKLMVCY
jgi:hypothetical protein